MSKPYTPSLDARAAPQPGSPAPDSMLGASPAMQEVVRFIARVAPTNAGVLLTGESGTGKELAAHTLHAASGRRAHRFLTLNCAAMPRGLIASELFGDERRKVAASAPGRAGLLERAAGGTLLLDEVSDVPLDIQARLLRVIESRKACREGADREYDCDVRILASSRRCPLNSVHAGVLREDLLYRLAVFPIELPPLRNRGADVELLAESFLAELNRQAGTQKRLTSAARVTLRLHAWPGNVRELKNCIERAFITSDAALDLAPLIANTPAQNIQAAFADGDAPNIPKLEIMVGSRIYDMERSLIEATLDHFKGNKRRAADALGCSLKTLYNKLNEYSQSQECAST